MESSSAGASNVEKPMIDLVGGSLVVTVLGLVGYTVKMNLDNSASRKRVYERMDEVKTKCDEDFTRKDVCGVVHDNVNKNLERIDRLMSDGFKELNTKMDKIINQNGS